MRHFIFFFLVLAGLPALADSKVKVITSLTDLAWAAKQVGGEHVDVKPLLNGTENPHYVDTVPEFIRLVADAQVVCIAGLQLEIGWMPKVLSRSGNAQVQPGGKGYCDTGRAVSVLEKPEGHVDRSMGDIHPAGNPHFWLSPKALAEGAKEIAGAFSRVDPAHTGDYQKGLAALTKQLDELQARNKAKLAPIAAKFQGPFVIEYHKEFSYFDEAYGLRCMGTIEEKPGIPPSAGRIAEISLAAKSAGIKVAFAGEYAPKNVLSRFKELSGIPVLQLPTASRPGDAEIGDYPKLEAAMVDRIVKFFKDNPK